MRRLSIDPPLDPDAYAHVHQIRARFGETDAMGVIHHGAYLLYLEEARVAWLRAMGHDYASLREEGLDFAVIESFVQYRLPLRFDDVIDVHVALGKMKRMTVQAGYLLTVDGDPRATAVTVHATVDTEGQPRSMPAWVAEQAGPLL
jgi:acyl-CoA thioester hydrolase